MKVNELFTRNEISAIKKIAGADVKMYPRGWTESMRKSAAKTAYERFLRGKTDGLHMVFISGNIALEWEKVKPTTNEKKYYNRAKKKWKRFAKEEDRIDREKRALRKKALNQLIQKAIKSMKKEVKK